MRLATPEGSVLLMTILWRYMEMCTIYEALYRRVFKGGGLAAAAVEHCMCGSF